MHKETQESERQRRFVNIGKGRQMELIMVPGEPLSEKEVEELYEDIAQLLVNMYFQDQEKGCHTSPPAP